MAPLILLAAALSGAAALIAEVVWFRGLGRGVGTSAEALAVVTAAFLGGLGIGAAIASRLAPRSTHPFRAAAICECAAGICVFLSPFAIGAVPGMHLWMLDTLHLEPGRSAWPAAVVAVPLLLIPCAFLGATLPFLVRGRITSLGHAGRWSGWLYAANTVGAAAGVGLAAFLLLTLLGETGALRVAAGGNVLAAILILLAERPAPDSTSEPASVAPPPAPPPPPERPTPPTPAPPTWTGSRRTAQLAGVALFVSGALALGGEVAWFRILEPITGIHVYGLAFLLIPVLLGTALGGALGGFLADRSKRPDLLLSTVLGFGGLATIASIFATGAVPWFVLTNLAEGAKDFEAEKWRVLGAALCVLPPLFVFALAYPIAIRARAASTEGAAAASGAVYAWNTAGNVAGSLAAGFVLLPAIGSPLTLAFLGGVGLVVAATLRLYAPPPRSTWGALPFLVPVAALAWPGVASMLRTAGPSLPEVIAIERWSAKCGRVQSRADMRAFAELVGGTYVRPVGRPDRPPIEPIDGVVSQVGILDEKGVIRLRQGGLSESRISALDPDAGSESEVALPILAWLLHEGEPEAKEGLVIGHGAGWTPEALLATGLESVDVAELEPAVLDIVERYRGPLEVRTNPKAHLRLTDGRLLLRAAAKEGGRYDVIVSQPSHPWVPGAGHLFTLEAYRLARSALKPGGVFAQWLNLFDMDRDLFQTAIASWYAAFPQSWMFLYNKEIVLVGFTTKTPHIDAARWDRAFADERFAWKAKQAGIAGPASLIRAFAADGNGIGRMLEPKTVPATDDDPRLELGLAWSRMTGAENIKPILQDIRRVFPPDFAAAIPDAAARTRWIVGAVRSLVSEKKNAEDSRLWDEKVFYDGGAEGRRVRAAEALLNKDPRGAEAHLRKAVVDFPEDPGVAEDWLSLLGDQGRYEEASKEGELLAPRFPTNGKIWNAWARALASGGEAEKAEKAFARALEAKSPRAPAGTGREYARLLLGSEPPRKFEAHTVLANDPSTYSDREAMRELVALDIEIGVVAETERYEKILHALDEDRGREQLLSARGNVTSDLATGYSQVVEATSLLPHDPVAWRMRGWYELRKGLPDAAAESFRKAITASRDKAAERARGAAFLRMFSADPSVLDGETPATLETGPR